MLALVCYILAKDCEPKRHCMVVIVKNIKKPCSAVVLNIRESRIARWHSFVKIVQRGVTLAFRGQFLPYYGKVMC